MRVEIHVTAGPIKGRRFIFDKPDFLLFGRATDAHISLPNDRYVSRQHFLLEISPPNCKLTDLNSKNGVFVNGIRYGGQLPPGKGVKQAPNKANEVYLENGDEISVGETHIKVFIQSERETLEKIPREALIDEKEQSAPNLSPGFLNIKDYHIEQEIRHGGIGTVYKAKEVNTGQTVAIKILPLHGKIDPHSIKTFQRELNIIRQLNHKNIVRFFGHGKTSDTLYFIFEFVDSIDLAKFIRLMKLFRFGLVSLMDWPMHTLQKSLFRISEGNVKPLRELCIEILSHKIFSCSIKGIPGFPKLLILVFLKVLNPPD
jgi:pSer/pThr/pTyr-binding forkhead associated (FHA) protein